MEFHSIDANTPLNVELRAFIESHFKCTIMNVKLIFRLGFGVKSQNIGVVDPSKAILDTIYFYYCCRQYRRNIDGKLLCHLIYFLQKSHLKTQHDEMGRAWLR